VVQGQACVVDRCEISGSHGGGGDDLLGSDTVWTHR
jgi:hypothetical protein